MTRYLLAAEADKIQDLLFRSARLREVVGGSQLLTRFCGEVPSPLLPPNAEVVVSDGGSFRILFDNKTQAQRVGECLAEVYHRATGGTLSVAEPMPVNGDFGAVSEQAEENLRRAKRWREGWQEQPHLPYMAFCASCGIGLAVAHRAYHEGEEPQYLCESCLNKDAERPAGELGEFLRDFYREVVGEEGLKRADWPGKEKRRDRKEIDPLEDVADYDSRRYAAYLLADGNDMGKVFGACQTPEQMRDLSTRLSPALRRALAEPTRMIPLDGRPNFIPVLPLILGGDDVFALIPAPWALDFAQRFCQAYEQEMQNLFAEIGLKGVSAPTVSAAVVICKSKHPYRLAHETGESRLKEAKRVVKRLGLNGGQPCSAVNFEVVLGGRLVGESPAGSVRPTLRPYWVSQSVSDGWGLPVQRLIEQRYELRHVPNKRLAELRDLYDDLPASLRPTDFAPWQDRLNRLLARIGRKEAHKEAFDAARSGLGGDASGWYRVVRQPEGTWHGHALPDLLDAWDFALALDKNRQEYEEEAR
ncbi:MAG: hypothetical protein JW934_10195 [Anaerolineae bacterium]|nr:hypothetical protein [Anaerolineae bacterium]